MTVTAGEMDVRSLVERVVASQGASPGPLLNVLHGVQDALGYIPDESIALIAEALNLSRAEVHGTISFYHYFRRQPAGRHVIHLCRAEACQSMNGRALEAHAQAALGVGLHETTADAAFTLEPVYCLGNCALSPAMMIDGQLFGRLTSARFDAIVAEWRKRD